MCSITEEMTVGVTRDDNNKPLATVTSDALTVHVGRSPVDGVPYVMIDTYGSGTMRVDLNDGNIWDGDPEEDQAHWLDGFEVALWTGNGITAPVVVCVACRLRVNGATMRRTLRECVADAKLHQCEVKS